MTNSYYTNAITRAVIMNFAEDCYNDWLIRHNYRNMLVWALEGGAFYAHKE